MTLSVMAAGEEHWQGHGRGLAPEPAPAQLDEGGAVALGCHVVTIWHP
jgi:hypothetical protein